MIKEQAITIQLGSFSNSIGAHVWNLRNQTSCNTNRSNSYSCASSSVFHRQTESTDSRHAAVTHPRALMIDTKDNINTFQVVSDEINMNQNTSNISNNFNNNALDIHHRDQSVASHESYYKRWKSWLEFDLHAKSTSSLPPWTNGTNFNTFLSGQNEDIISAEYIESVLDQYRYFAEECDYLSSVVIIADVYNGYGGLLCTLLEDIRQDSNTISVPIFAITSSLSSSSSSSSMSADAAQHTGTLNETLRSLNIPLSYAKMCEYSNTIIPINPMLVNQLMKFHSPLEQQQQQQQHTYDNIDYLMNKYHTSAVIATAIETLLTPVSLGYQSESTHHSGYGTADEEREAIESDERMRHDNSSGSNHHYQHYQGQQYDEDEKDERKIYSSSPSWLSHMSISEWCNTVSGNKQFPFSKIECSIPSPLTSFLHASLPSSASSSTSNNNNNRSGGNRGDDIVHTKLDDFLSKYFMDSRNGVITPTGTLNPFLHSLSSVDYNMSSNSSGGSGVGIYGNIITMRTRSQRAFSNLLIFRGDAFQTDLIDKLFQKCVGSTYSLSTCLQCPKPIMHSNNFPNIRYNNDACDSSDSYHQQTHENQKMVTLAAAAVGADSTVGIHLHSVLSALTRLGYQSGSMRSGGYGTTDGDEGDEEYFPSTTTSTTGGSEKKNSSSGSRRSGVSGVRVGGSVNVRSQLESQGFERDECLQMIEVLSDCVSRYED